jgi:hypothetical protein
MNWRFPEPGMHFSSTGPLGRIAPRGSYLGLSLHGGSNVLEQFLHPRPVGQNRGNQTAAREAFRRALLKMQIDARTREGKKFIAGLDGEDLGPIPNGEQMRSDIAKRFNKMWAEVEAAHKARKDAHKGDSIRVASGYRTADYDNDKWDGAFNKACRKTLAERQRTGDEYGTRALDIIFRFINGKKAPPGYSGHTHGIAADLNTVENGRRWIVDSDYDHQVGWQTTWLYQWLVENAWKHKFYQLKTETWHWEFHEGSPPSQCWGGKVKIRPVPRNSSQ